MMLIFSVTHGNEWTGHYALTSQKVRKVIPSENLIMANEPAFKANKRYLDTDLNRAFKLLDDPNKQNLWEVLRAKEITEMLNNDPSPFLLDLHTTTANMGVTVIFSEMAKEIFQVLGTLHKRLPHVNFIHSPDPTKQYLMGQKPFGLIVEIGPVAQATLHPQRLSQMQEVTLALWDIIESQHYLNFQGQVNFFRDESLVPYIKKDGLLFSMVHPSRQDKDLELVMPGSPLLLTFDGKTITSQASGPRYPIFINEAAYYEKGYAMELTTLESFQV